MTGKVFDKTSFMERCEPIISAPVNTMAGHVGADKLWARFFESPYGTQMDEQPYRFAHDFGYDRTAMVNDLGMDVLPRDHQLETGLYVTYLLEAELTTNGALPIEQNDIGVVVLAALLHDIGESTHPEIASEINVVGDIPFGRKTDQDRKNEAAVRAYLYKQLYPDIRPEVLDSIESIISHIDTSELHDIFEAAHCLQTVDTAIRAQVAFEREFEKLMADHTKMTRDLDVLSKLGKLYSKVMRHQVPNLVKYAKKYEFVGQFVLAHANYVI